MRRGFVIKYDTNIPRGVGLSGSSAIVTAAFRALLKFHHLTLGALGLCLNTLPEVILTTETRELNISAGLQDRVVQSFGGLVYMDFHQVSDERNECAPCCERPQGGAAPIKPSAAESQAQRSGKGVVVGGSSPLLKISSNIKH